MRRTSSPSRRTSAPRSTRSRTTTGWGMRTTTATTPAPTTTGVTITATTARATTPATITVAAGPTTAAGIASSHLEARLCAPSPLRETAFFLAGLLICEFRADEKNGGHERGDPRRLSRHRSYTGCLPQARGARGAHLQRSRAGDRRARRSIERHRGAGADPRAHADPRAAPRAATEAQTHQPAERLPAHRRRRLHASRHRRLLQHASGHAVVLDGGADLGPHPRRRARDTAERRRAESGEVAGRGRLDAAGKDAGDLRVWPHRRRSREGGSRDGPRGSRLGARSVARESARRRASGRTKQGGLLCR